MGQIPFGSTQARTRPPIPPKELDPGMEMYGGWPWRDFSNHKPKNNVPFPPPPIPKGPDTSLINGKSDPKLAALIDFSCLAILASFLLGLTVGLLLGSL